MDSKIVHSEGTVPACLDPGSSGDCDCVPPLAVCFEMKDYSPTHSPFTICKGELPDLDMICSLEERIFNVEDRFSRRQLRYLLVSPNVTFLFCRWNEDSIGYGIALISRLRNGQRKGRIYSIGILRRFRRHGAGSLLLFALEDWLREKSVAFITLETKNGSRGAADFFYKHGYATQKPLTHYYGSTPGIRMRKNV